MKYHWQWRHLRKINEKLSHFKNYILYFIVLKSWNSHSFHTFWKKLYLLSESYGQLKAFITSEFGFSFKIFNITNFSWFVIPIKITFVIPESNDHTHFYRPVNWASKRVGKLSKGHNTKSRTETRISISPLCYLPKCQELHPVLSF